MQPLDRSIPPSQKAIPPARDRLQSRLLVWMVTPLLLVHLPAALLPAYGSIDLYLSLPGNPYAAPSPLHRYVIEALAVSISFAFLAWMMRAATPGAAALGGLSCLSLTDFGAMYGLPPALSHTLFPSLALLFVLTWAATRFRRAKKEVSGVAEARTGRRASQVIANLGVAALCITFSGIHHTHNYWACYFAALAALAEATADTLSSEIGQGIAGPAFLITNLRQVPPGTDGAISLAGTFAGIFGAAAVILVGFPRPFWRTTPMLFAAIFLAASAGLLFDSLLGAALERRGWLGNDLVNFLSTAFAALVSWPLFLFAARLLRF